MNTDLRRWMSSCRRRHWLSHQESWQRFIRTTNSTWRSSPSQVCPRICWSHPRHADIQQDIFRNRQDVSPTKLAELYQQLACEYYLVPADPKARPTVPGLTLTGWARWMTLAMRAYPNEEAQRLAKAVSALPINADSPLDGKPERLPKQLSRRLLPEKADRQARMLFDAALKGHLEATRPASPTTNPTPTPTSQSAPSSRPQSPRSRYRPAGLPSPPASQAGDDRDDHHPHPNSRRRSSYREHSGSARTYEPNTNTTSPTAARRDAAGPAAPPSSPVSSRPPSTSRRTSPLPPSHHRHSVSGGVTVSGGRTGPERGYTWPYVGGGRGSSSPVGERESVVGRRGSGGGERERERERDRERRDREGRDRDRERDRDRDRERERERDRERPRERERNRDRDRDRERDRERERERERDRERERERDRRERPERPRERRSASVAGFPDRRSSSYRKTQVVVRDERDGSGRNQTWGEFLAKEGR